MEMQTRLKQAFTVLLDTSFGTLWWVSNDLWKQEKSFVLKPEQEGKNHPGVSLCAERQKDPYVVPMLLGRSKKQSANAAVEVELSAGGRGYFGTLKPVRMSYVEFLNGNIHANSAKPRVTPEEKAKLKKFLIRRLSWSMK